MKSFGRYLAGMFVTLPALAGCSGLTTYFLHPDRHEIQNPLSVEDYQKYDRDGKHIAPRDQENAHVVLEW